MNDNRRTIAAMTDGPDFGPAPTNPGDLSRASVAASAARAMAEAGVARPDTAPTRELGPIAEALGFTRDRLLNIEHQLGDLNGVLERLGYELRPVLAGDGDAIPEPEREHRPENPDAVDNRSTVARRITALGHQADDLVLLVAYLRNKALGYVEALELEGVLR